MVRTRKRTPNAEITDPLELAPTVPHIVAETTRLIRLTPVGNDLAMPYLQIALVATGTEDQARQLATAYDPFGRDWTNADLFAADAFDDANKHVVGDVIFKSIPKP